MKPDLLDFWKKHDLIASTVNHEPYVSTPLKCRFCGKTETETTFKSIAHAIPELLGKNNTHVKDECDECNKKFSGYESHLSIFFLPYLTMVGVKGKRKIPEFHSRTINGDENTRTVVKTINDNQRNVILNNINDYKVDVENKTAALTFRKPPHIPYLVYKSLVKIALSILPAHLLEKYSNVFDWLLDKSFETHCFIGIGYTVWSKSKFKEPYAELYAAKNTIEGENFKPELLLILYFGNIVLQVLIPLSKEFDYEKAKELTPAVDFFPPYRLMLREEKTSLVFRQVDLKSKTSITYDETLHFKFQSGDFNIEK